MPRGVPNEPKPTVTKVATADEVKAPDEAAEDTAADPGGDAASADPDSTPAAADAPCPDCFPTGWPAGSTAVGCEHGNWDR